MTSFQRPPTGLVRRRAATFLAVAAIVSLASCDGGAAPATPPIEPGRIDAPREVNLIARDYSFQPATLELVPGETILLHVVNGGLDVHEAIIGPGAVQDAWETAEAAAADPPPGPTPVVTVPTEHAGLRVVVASGQRIDVVWSVPTTAEVLIVGCHIPGHWGRGMQIPVVWVARPDAWLAEPSARTGARWYALGPPRSGRFS